MNETHEGELTLDEARNLLHTRPQLATIYRWCLHGCRGVKLDYQRIGRRIVTTRAAIDKFRDALTAQDANRSTPPPRPPRQLKIRPSARREKAIASAEQTLAATGFHE